MDVLRSELLHSFELVVRIPSLYTCQYALGMQNCIPCYFWSTNRAGSLVCDEVHVELFSFLHVSLCPLRCSTVSFLDDSSDMED